MAERKVAQLQLLDQYDSLWNTLGAYGAGNRRLTMFGVCVFDQRECRLTNTPTNLNNGTHIWTKQI
jgi:hypothetical protein